MRVRLSDELKEYMREQGVDDIMVDYTNCAS